MKWRLVEEFGPECFEEKEDGRLLLVENYYDFENMVMRLLTFGEKVEVLEPPEDREKLKSIAESMINKYK